MVETVKTQAALLAQMADGGNNTAEEVRDNIVSGWTPGWVRYLDHRLPSETAHADDDFFTGDSSADYTEVAASGSATWTYGTLGVLSCHFINQSNLDWAAALKALTPNSAPVTIESRVTPMTLDNGFIAVGIGFADGVLTSSTMQAAVLGSAGTGTLGRLAPTDGGTITNSDWLTHDIPNTFVGGSIYMRVVWEGSNTFSWSVSPDGVSWTSFGDADVTPTLTPTHFGAFVTAYGNNIRQAVSFDYFRVYESDLSV